MQRYELNFASAKGRYFTESPPTQGNGKIKYIKTKAPSYTVSAADLTHLRKRIANDSRIWKITDAIYVYNADTKKYLGMFIAYQLKTRKKGEILLCWRKHTTGSNGDPEWEIDKKTGKVLKNNPWENHPTIMAMREVKWSPWEN